MAKAHFERFLGCVLSDTELTLDNKYYPYINEASFSDRWIELTVAVRYSEARNFDVLVKPLRDAKKIVISLGTYPTSEHSAQVQRTFESVALVSEHYETRPLWHARTEGEGMQNIDGKNAPAWYAIFRFEVQS